MQPLFTYKQWRDYEAGTRYFADGQAPEPGFEPACHHDDDFSPVFARGHVLGGAREPKMGGFQSFEDFALINMDLIEVMQ